MKKEKKVTFSGIFKGIIIVLLLIILSINVWVMFQAKSNPNSVPSIFGYKPFVVLSGSMETKISVGDLVFVKEIDPSTLKTGDIIAFRDSNNYVTTHRIVGKIDTEKGTCFETKGDNNNTNDKDPVCFDSIEGKYQTKIAKIGNIILFIQQPLGFMIMMTAILVICVFIYLVSNRETGISISEDELKEFEEYKKKKEKETKEKAKKD